MRRFSIFVATVAICVAAATAATDTYQGHIVDVLNRVIYDGKIVVTDGIIVDIEKCNLPEQPNGYPYIMPGFIDSHIHVESSMMPPLEFGNVAVTHGTIGVVSDPHEIANVMGIEGIDFMIQSGEHSLLNFCFGAPSCVPSLSNDVETNGATIDAADIEKLLARDDIGFLAEMMNYVGVLNNDEQVMAKIRSAIRHGKPIDGHASGLVYAQRQQYAAAGITTDHECSSLAEGRDCIKAGISVIIREGSAAKNYEALIPLIDESPDKVMFCTDDCHPDDLVCGHIDIIVKRALNDGYNLWHVLQAACVNPQRHYRLNWGMLQKGDPATFIVVDKLNPHFRVQRTIINGVESFNYNNSYRAIKSQITSFRKINNDNDEFPNNFKAKPLKISDINFNIESGDTAHVICAYDASLNTRHDAEVIIGDPLIDSHYPWTEVQKIVVYNRYDTNARPIVGLIRGFNLHNGAIASSVAHDSHNIVAIGSSDEFIVRAINRVIEMKGGQVVVNNDDIYDIPLPIAGIMAPLNAYEIAYRTLNMNEVIESMGCSMKSPFITMAFMCLPVIPEIKITDKHLWNSRATTPIY